MCVTDQDEGSHFYNGGHKVCSNNKAVTAQPWRCLIAPELLIGFH